jgi:hypothetical protein
MALWENVYWMLHQNFTADENLVPGLYKLIETEERDVKIQITYKERLTIEKIYFANRGSRG